VAVASYEVGVGTQNEEPFTEMGGSAASRRKHAPLRIPPDAGNVGEDSVEPHANVARDVLKECVSRLYLANNSPHVVPYPAFIFEAGLKSGARKRLAGIAAVNDIHEATPRSAVEGGEVVPDRSRCQGAFFHTTGQRRGAITFPLKETHGAVSGHGNMQAKPNSLDSRAE